MRTNVVDLLKKIKHREKVLKKAYETLQSILHDKKNPESFQHDLNTRDALQLLDPQQFLWMLLSFAKSDRFPQRSIKNWK